MKKWYVFSISLLFSFPVYPGKSLREICSQDKTKFLKKALLPKEISEDGDNQPLPGIALVINDKEMDSLDGLDEILSDENINRAVPEGIQILSFAGNQIRSLSPFERINKELLDKIVSLDLAGNQISNISYLSNLKNLKALYVNGNKLEDISNISEHKSLIALDISENPIRTLDPIRNLTNLQDVGLQKVPVKDFTPLDGSKDSLRMIRLHFIVPPEDIPNLGSFPYLDDKVKFGLWKTKELLDSRKSEAQIRKANEIYERQNSQAKANLVRSLTVIQAHNNSVASSSTYSFLLKKTEEEATCFCCKKINSEFKNFYSLPCGHTFHANCLLSKNREIRDNFSGKFKCSACSRNFSYRITESKIWINPNHEE